MSLINLHINVHQFPFFFNFKKSSFCLTSCSRNQEIKVQIWKKKKKKAFSLEQGVMSLCLRPNPLRKLFFEKKKIEKTDLE